MTKEKDTKDLSKLTRTKLIEEAKKYPGIVGATGMSKEELLEAIRAEKSALGEEAPEAAASPEPVGKKEKKEKKRAAGKAEVKAAMQKLRDQRREALEARDALGLKRARRSYKRLNRVLRRLAAAAK